MYCLPRAAIDVLARSGNAANRVIDKPAAEAEHDFATMCQKARAVGFWYGAPVRYPYLSPRPSATTALAMLSQFSPSEKSHFREASRKGDAIHARLAGVAGWLCVDPDYLEEVRSLKTQWHQLPPDEQPSFPLMRPMPLPAKIRKGPTTGEAATSFIEELRRFLDKWQLTHLASWDLPCPQGPLLPNPLPPGSCAIPSQGIQNIVPSHFHLQGNDDLERTIVQQQQESMAENGIAIGFGVGGHHEAYWQILQVRHIETTVSRRYGNARRGSGLVVSMEVAIAAALSCSVPHVQRLRKGISRCLRGERASVSWLRNPRL
jgi:hypothetical protein